MEPGRGTHHISGTRRNTDVDARVIAPSAFQLLLSKGNVLRCQFHGFVCFRNHLGIRGGQGPAGKVGVRQSVRICDDKSGPAIVRRYIVGTASYNNLLAIPFE